MNILEVCRNGQCKTRIFYDTRLSFSHCMKYVHELKELGFLASSNEDIRGSEFVTTVEGLQLLAIYDKIAKHLNESEK